MPNNNNEIVITDVDPTANSDQPPITPIPKLNTNELDNQNKSNYEKAIANEQRLEWLRNPETIKVFNELKFAREKLLIVVEDNNSTAHLNLVVGLEKARTIRWLIDCLVNNKPLYK